MPYTKKRVRQHIMEDRSFQIVRELLPEEWVIREYKPDYGIDLSVELFEYVDEDRTIAATLGETLFVQVKSTEVVREHVLQVYGRRNVELGPLQEDASDSAEIEVARLQLDTSELLTIQTMGSAIPVLLFLVELSTRRIYYVCLNDLIEKVIIPGDPSYVSKQSKLIHIPLRNRISSDSPLSVLPLGTYGKRSKLYAAFGKFAYQKHQLEFAWAAYEDSGSETTRKDAAERLIALIRHFHSNILQYDFWTRMPEWEPIAWAHKELLGLQALIGTPDAYEDLSRLREFLQTTFWYRLKEPYVSTLSLEDARSHAFSHVLSIWHRLDNLSRMYEELAKEWFLPTYLSTLLGDDLREPKVQEPES